MNLSCIVPLENSQLIRCELKQVINTCKMYEMVESLQPFSNFKLKLHSVSVFV